MTRKVKISFLILVWSIVAVQMYVNYQDKEKQTAAVTAFSVVDKNIKAETIKGYGFFGKLEISENMKKSMLQNLAFKLGIEQGYTFSTGKGDGFEKIILKQTGEKKSTELQFITIVGEENPEQYISMEIHTVAQVDGAFLLYEDMKRIFDEIGIQGQVSLEVEIEKDGYMEEKEKESYVNKIFDQAEAKVVGTICENGVDTVYGYTRNEKVYMDFGKKRINMQMAFLYDEVNNKTYIKVGMPLVNSSY